MKYRLIIFNLLPIFLASFISKASADSFVFVGSIQSTHGLYYTTMAQQGSFIAMGDQRSPGAGIDIIDASEPAEMELAGSVHTGHMTYSLDWEGNYVYSPGSWDGFYVYDVSDQGNIHLVCHLALGGQPICGVSARGNRAYVASELNGSGGGLYVLDITYPSNPAPVWSSGFLGCAEIKLGQSLAYAYSLYNRIFILDILYPDSPHLVSQVSCSEANGIDVDETRQLLYVTGWGMGLQIYDISNPAQPRILSTTALPSPAAAIDVDHSKVYRQIVFVSGYIGGLWALDTSDPSNPQFAASYFPSNGQCNYVMVRDNYVFLTSPDCLTALQYDCSTSTNDEPAKPGEISLSQNYPNPFNAQTTISYTLSSSNQVELSIFNLLGQKITTLYQGIQQAGEHQVIWDASALPWGVYFARLEAGEKRQIVKMTLTK
jgi:hypothetical protein